MGRSVVERMADMFAPQTPWANRLWRPSTIEALRHCLSLIEGGARETAKAYALAQVRSALLEDLAIHGRDRGGLLKSLQLDAKKMVAQSVTHARLSAVLEEIERRYPDWLRSMLDDLQDIEPVAGSKVDCDRLSWQLAAYLRSAGMSDKWIANYCHHELKFRVEEESLATVMRRALTVAAGEPGWTFLIPLSERRSFNEEAPPLLSRREFERRFKELFPGLDIPPHRGGVEIAANAVDKYGAIELVQVELQRLTDRYNASMTRRRITFGSEAWVSPGAWSTNVEPVARRRLVVRQLDVAGGAELFSRVSEELEASLDLLTAAERTSSRAATIAAWGVLETLFADDSDYGQLVNVAERAADILLCLYVRDAFRSVARGHARFGKDSFATQLRGSSESAAALLVESALAEFSPSTNATLGEIARARISRLSKLELERVHSQLAGVFHRLYDLRNQIVHAGSMSPFGLERTYEESIVLLSALLDELLVQRRERGRGARDVAGRAAWLIGRVESDRATPASLVEIVES